MSVLSSVQAGLLAALPAPPTDRLELGPLTFRLYGLMIALGVVAAVEIGRRRWAARGGNPDDIAEIATRAVPAGLLGARAYHVLTDWTAYRGRWIETLYIWKGGLGIPGGLVAGVGVGIWYARRQGWDVRALIDAVLPGIPVA
ncbi:MAG: prolipoprotein diacylglyceryl transferase, partial [Actinomycetota bacterium]|nr:prolipoprotein diacylglyceryl transferase [Actinomycetota bacterium]